MSFNRIKSQLLLRLLFKAAWVRKDRALTALVSVAVVATIATAALTIYFDLEGKLSRQFRGFGANVIVTKQQGSLTADELAKLSTVINGKGEVVPVAYAIATANNSRVVLGGANLRKLVELNSSWKVESVHPYAGIMPPEPVHSALVGSRAAESLITSSLLKISFGQKSENIWPEEIFRSGSDDDSRIYLDLADFTALTGVEPSTALVRVEGKPQEIQAAIASLSAALPGIEVKPVRQITQAQTAVVGKTRAVVLASSSVVVVLIMLCMAATFTGSVLERRKDFAVMKALGASNRTVNFLFASEAALLALAGSSAG
jgi:putative ABC transport system permease protein